MSAVKTPLELLSTTPTQTYAAAAPPAWDSEGRSVPRTAPPQSSERAPPSLMSYGWSSSPGGGGGGGSGGGSSSGPPSHQLNEAAGAPAYYGNGHSHSVTHPASSHNNGSSSSYASPHHPHSLLAHSPAMQSSHASSGTQLPPAHSLASWLSPNPGQQPVPPSPPGHSVPSGYTSNAPRGFAAGPDSHAASQHHMHSNQHSSPSGQQASHGLPLFTSAWASHQHQQQQPSSSSHYGSGSGLASGSSHPLASPQTYASSPGSAAGHHQHHHAGHHHPQSYSAPSYTSPLPGSYANDMQGSYHNNVSSHYGSQQPSPALGLSPLGLGFDGYGNGGHPARSRYEGHSASFSAGSGHENGGGSGGGGALHLHGARSSGGPGGSDMSTPYARPYGSGGPFGLPPPRGSLTPATNSPSTPRTSLSALRSVSDSASAAASSSTSPAMHTLNTLHSYSNDDDRWAALVSRSHAADRSFVYGALTTRIYCRPSCASKCPDRNRVKFFSFPGASAQAEAAGFRACKRCKPGTQGTADQCVLAVGECARHIANSAVAGESGDGELKRKTLKEYAARAGLSAFHFHRTFKAVCSLTPGEFAKACHALALQDSLGRDATHTGDMITSQDLARALMGWSTRRARRAVGGVLPSSYAAGLIELDMIQVTARDTPFGLVSVLFTDSVEPNGSDASQEEYEGTLFACLVGHDAERRLQVRCPTARRQPEREAWLSGIVNELFRSGSREVQLSDSIIPSIRRARVWNAVRKDLERKSGDEDDESSEKSKPPQMTPSKMQSQPQQQQQSGSHEPQHHFSSPQLHQDQYEWQQSQQQQQHHQEQQDHHAHAHAHHQHAQQAPPQLPGLLNGPLGPLRTGM